MVCVDVETTWAMLRALQGLQWHEHVEPSYLHHLRLHLGRLPSMPTYMLTHLFTALTKVRCLAGRLRTLDLRMEGIPCLGLRPNWLVSDARAEPLQRLQIDVRDTNMDAESIEHLLHALGPCDQLRLDLRGNNAVVYPWTEGTLTMAIRNACRGCVCVCIDERTETFVAFLSECGRSGLKIV